MAARPPPIAKPRIRAITGFLKLISLLRPTAFAASYAAWASALLRFFSNWLMSAPETNALLPAPVRITQLTLLSSLNSSMMSPRPVHISMDMALRFSGWLKVIRPTPSSFAANIFPLAKARVSA